MNYLVSVIITTHNRVDLLPRAINSVLRQTYKNIELIIIDDGSTDATEKLIKKYKNQYGNIIYIKHSKPLGANVARNKGINIAQGKFIAGLDDDDEFTPDRIELLLKNYDENYSLITSDDIIIKSNGNKKNTNKPTLITLKNMLSKNVVGNQVLVEKNRILSLGGFDESLTASQDYDMWLRIIQKYGNAKVVKKPLQYIYASDSVKRISSSGFKKFSGYFNFYKKHKKLFRRKERKYQLARLYKAKNKNMSLKTLYVLFSLYSLKEYIKSKLIYKKR